MGGTSDWAIDLDIEDDDSGGGDGDGATAVIIDPSIYDDPNPEVTCRPPCTFVLPPWTLPYTTTITPTPVTSAVLLQWPSISTGGGDEHRCHIQNYRHNNHSCTSHNLLHFRHSNRLLGRLLRAFRWRNIHDLVLHHRML